MKHWKGVIDDRGRFAISADVLDGLEEASLLSNVPNDSYGRSTVGLLNSAGFELLPTTIRIPVGLPAYAFQPWHFSVILTIPGLRGEAEPDSPEWLAVKDSITSELERLLRLFEPRLEDCRVQGGPRFHNRILRN